MPTCSSLLAFCIFSVKYPNYRHFSFLHLLACQADHTAERETCNHIGQAPTKTSCRLHTEEGGQDRMCCGLHLKHTSPEEALVVQSERWRRTSDSFHWLDLNEKKKQTDGEMDTQMSEDGWTLISVSFVNTSLSAALWDSVLQRCHGIKRGSDYGLLVCEVFKGNLWNTHEWYSPFACQKYDWWRWITHSNFNHPLLLKMKDFVVLWC